jgi:hypothetical protein
MQYQAVLMQYQAVLMQYQAVLMQYQAVLMPFHRRRSSDNAGSEGPGYCSWKPWKEV